MKFDENKTIDIQGQIQESIVKLTKGFITETPVLADYMNTVITQLINNDVTLDAHTTVALEAVQLNQMAMAIEVEILKGAMLTGVDSNIVVETFMDLEDINLKYGTYKQELKTISLT